MDSLAVFDGQTTILLSSPYVHAEKNGLPLRCAPRRNPQRIDIRLRLRHDVRLAGDRFSTPLPGAGTNRSLDRGQLELEPGFGEQNQLRDFAEALPSFGQEQVFAWESRLWYNANGTTE